jgi:hypothetical protein
MTKSEELVAKAKALLFPPEGVEYELAFHKGMREIPYGSEPHDFCNAVSHGLRVVVMGESGEVHQRRQFKPFDPNFPGIHRRMLTAVLNGVYVHFIGDLVIIADRQLRVGEILPGARKK